MQTRLLVSLRALAHTMRTRDLRRVQLAFAAARTSSWAMTVVVGVIAYRDGGAVLVGIISALRTALPGLVAPVASAFADRRRRDSVLVASGVVRAATTGLAAIVLATHGPLLVFYVLSVLASCASILVRSANAAIVPLLCRSPLELTSAMASRGLLESGSALVGPLLAALLLAVSTPAATVAVIAVLAAASSVPLVGLAYEVPVRAVAAFSMAAILREVADGFRVLLRQRDASALVGIALVQAFIRGCLTVFLVVLGFTVLRTGQAGVGLLTAAVGAGATVASVAVFALVSGRRLAAVGGAGIALWGLPLVASAAVPWAPALVTFMTAIGIGSSLVDFGSFTLLARLVPEALLGRLFGTFESVVALAVAAGALLTPVLIAHLGLRASLLLVGLLAPFAVLLASPRLRQIDRMIGRRDQEIDVLRRVAMFQPLPLPVIEQMAVGVRRAHVDAGVEVFRQGDEGDFLYVIDDGTAEVIGDGTVIRRLHKGDCFGEVALLRATPRTATVRAQTRLDVYTLGRAEFLLAVAGCSATGQEAQRLLSDRLATFAPAAP